VALLPQQGKLRRAAVRCDLAALHRDAARLAARQVDRKLGTPQASDRLLYATPERPGLLHFVEVSGSGRHALVTSTPGIQANSLVVIDLADPRWQLRAWSAAA